MFYVWVSIFCALLFNVVCPMQHNTKLKKIYSKEIARYKSVLSKLGEIPTFLDTQEHGEIVQWDPKQSIAVTHFGGMYVYEHGSWIQIHKGECASQEEFLNGISTENLHRTKPISLWNLSAHVDRNKFPFFVYHKGTRSLMYPIHEEKEYRRVAIRADMRSVFYYPTKLVFERDGNIVNQYDTKLSHEMDKIVSCACNHDGTYYAVCSCHVDNDNKRFWSEVKVCKQLPDMLYGDDPCDALTQGNHPHKKSFVLLTKEDTAESQASENVIQDFYFSNNHVNCHTIQSDQIALKWIISPQYGASQYACKVDCGDQQYVSLAKTRRFSLLYKKLLESKSSIQTRDTRIPVILFALEQYLPKEVRQKIVYDLSYMDATLRKGCALVYGSDDDTFPQKEKDAFRVLNDLNHSTVAGLKQQTIDDFKKDDLWNAAKYGILWQEGIAFKKGVLSSSQILTSLFQGLKFSPYKEILIQKPAYVVKIQSEGFIFIKPLALDGNKFCGECMRHSFCSNYIAQEVKAEEWGTKAHAQQFVDDNTVKNVEFNHQNRQFVATLNNGKQIISNTLILN